MKKLLITFLLSTILGWSCCGKPEFPYWNVLDYKIDIRDLEYNEPVSGKIETDTLVLTLDFETEVLAYQKTMTFGNTCLAFQCPENGGNGMKDPIKEIVITSDSTFNDIKAHESLNKIVDMRGDTMDEWVKESKHWELEYYHSIHFNLVEKPQTIKNHKFKVKMVFESGRIIERETDRVIWN